MLYNNPLHEFYKTSGYSMRDIARSSGISYPQIVRLVQKEKAKDLEDVRLSTLFAIQIATGVDMISFVRDTLYPALKEA